MASVDLNRVVRLYREFVSPPDGARPRVWWHWMDGNVTEEGIEKDLQWMKRIGIAGIQHFDATLETPRAVAERLVYMSPEWRRKLRYATALADRLGLEFGIASSPGWSETGGPWVDACDGMKKLVWSERQISGGGPFRNVLPAPPSIAGPFQELPILSGETAGRAEGMRFYRDVRVIGFRTPPGLVHDAQPVRVTASDEEVDALPLVAGRYADPVLLRCSTEEEAWVLFDYGRSHIFRAASVAVPSTKAFSYSLECSDDGKDFRRVVEFPRGYFLRHVTVSFPAIAARFLRVLMRVAPMPEPFHLGANAPGAIVSPFIKGSDRVALNQVSFFSGARIHRFEEKAGFCIPSRYYTLGMVTDSRGEAVDPESVIDLTDRLSASGELNWDVPEGDWTVLRLGYSLTGKTNHPASQEATGLEVDKLDERAVKAYMETYLAKFEEAVGPEYMGKRGVRAFVTDSIEAAGQNWSPALIAEFNERRGYDLLGWLPCLTGVIVGDAARSDRFLWDFRKTLMELMAEAHYGQIAKIAHARGLLCYGESLEGYPMMAMGDDLDMRQFTDVPMAALWTNFNPAERNGLDYHLADMRGAASVAHFFGRSLVAAEALTSAYEPWAFSPAMLRPIIDLAFALGVNRPVIHASVHQPDERKPGITLGSYGQHFSRHETWAELAEPWITYLSRCAYLLQQGRFVADVAWFYGEEGSLASLYSEGEPSDLPEGYGFDFVNANMLINHSGAERGRLISSGGATYRLLYLGGSSDCMTLNVLRKVHDLANQGVTIVGRRPIGSPSLADVSKGGEYQHLVDALWDTGKVDTRCDAPSALARLGVEPDFEYERPKSDSHIMFVHRELCDGDLYFVSNRKGRSERIEAVFRVIGRRPELWRSDSGEREAVSWRVESGRTVVTLEFRALESFFIVFREPTAAHAESVSPTVESPILRIEGHWQLRLEPQKGAPEQAILTLLKSLTESAEPGIRYFSGMATYSKTFYADNTVQRERERLIIDLGEVHELAEVSLNDQLIGIVWQPPFEVDVTGKVKAGANSLVVRVANLWVNRLIGDEQPGSVRVAFTAIPTYEAGAPLRPSGLLGPVTLKRRSL